MPPTLNNGNTYRDRVGTDAAGQAVCAFYAERYRHSPLAVWQERLAVGQISRNGQRLQADAALAAGDRLCWQRPSWQEGAVPALPAPLVDDGDLVVFNKPSGLPVLPAGGWLEHTVLGQIERQVVAGGLAAGAGRPRPVHRLGRFTSGLLLCARRAETRGWLSALLRSSTALADEATSVALSASPCRKTYRALLQPPLSGSPLLALQPGDSLVLTTPIGRRRHARLGTIWAAAGAAPTTPLAAAFAPLPASSAPLPARSAPLQARSTLTLLQRAEGHWLVELTIASGRPHQIRIHAAAADAPLLGDPLYGPGGVPCHQALPGDGGYHLHAHRLRLPLPDGRLLELEAPLPQRLRLGARAGADG
ncbi:MAG: pseudouridine synthase [Cyanobacteriota bacterium]|nr:pseudouridine synthase [Cyanobacteriota bacterium]